MIVTSAVNNRIESLIMRDLEYAAMYLEKRNYFISRALTKYIACSNLYAISYIRFTSTAKGGYHIITVGAERGNIRRWLQPLVTDTVASTLTNITHVRTTIPFQQQIIDTYDEGIIISWPQKEHERTFLSQLVLDGLQAISYVEWKEDEYFYDIGTPFEKDITRSIQEKDTDGLFELLSLTKSMTDS